MPKRKKSAEPTIHGIVGVGLDSADTQTRLTRTDEMLLLGGSEETHVKMQETAIRFQEKLEDSGKNLRELSLAEAADYLREAHDKSR